MEKNKFDFDFLIATWFGLGKSPLAPGTVGSLAAVVIWFFVNKFIFLVSKSLIFFYSFWLGFLFLLFFLGARSATIYSKKINKDDPGEIVVDEVVGQLIALIFSSFFLAPNLISAVFLCFLFFRIFDIAKPSIIKSSEKWFDGGYGIMIDDVLAGFCAGLVAVFLTIFF